MRLAKIRGTVVSTCKEPSLQGVKFLLVQFLSESENRCRTTKSLLMWSARERVSGF